MADERKNLKDRAERERDGERAQDAFQENEATKPRGMRVSSSTRKIALPPPPAGMPLPGVSPAPAVEPRPVERARAAPHPGGTSGAETFIGAAPGSSADGQVSRQVAMAAAHLAHWPAGAPTSPGAAVPVNPTTAPAAPPSVAPGAQTMVIQAVSPTQPIYSMQAVSPSELVSEETQVRRTSIFQKIGGAERTLPATVRVHKLPPPATIDPALILTRAPDSAAAATFRVLRHRLSGHKGVRVIQVTSTRERRSKTLAAANLALALGESGRARVLLVEADLQRPRLAEMFGFQPPVCLTRQLELHRARSAQPWAVVETGLPWLHFLAVDPAHDAGTLLDGPALGQCLDELRTGYDAIVVDTPPVLGSADANLVEEHVDGIVLVVRAGKVRARAVRTAIDQIGRTKLLGLVLVGN